MLRVIYQRPWAAELAESRGAPRMRAATRHHARTSRAACFETISADLWSEPKTALHNATVCRGEDLCFMRVYGYYSEQARVGELLEGRAHRGRAAAGPSARVRGGAA